MMDKVKFIKPPICSICGKTLNINKDIANKNGALICGECIRENYYFDKASSVFVYNKAISRAIQSFKYKNKFFLSTYFFDYIKDKINDFDDVIDIMAPVPMHIMRLRKRGYNQAALLVKEFEKIGCKNIIIYDLLKRVSNDKPQAMLTFAKRKNNLKRAFKINKKYIDKIIDKNVLIIDDVFTSGTTVNECSKVLKQHGVKKVFVLTIAKTCIN
jgi:ComF family protein